MLVSAISGAKAHLYVLGHIGVRLGQALAGIRVRVAGREHVPLDRAAVLRDKSGGAIAAIRSQAPIVAVAGPSGGIAVRRCGSTLRPATVSAGIGVPI